jgi:hypothetical protein
MMTISRILLFVFPFRTPTFSISSSACSVVV